MTTQAERRRQIGADNKSARQASGRAMRDDMRALSETPKVREPLPVVPRRGSMRSVRGVGSIESTTARGTGSGIASPLIEAEGSRIYHPPSVVVPADGYFFYSVRSVSKLTMEDADGQEVEIYLNEAAYANP